MAISKTYLDKKNKNKMVMFGGAAEEGTDTTTRKKQKQLLANAMKRTSEWVFSQEIPSDVTVQAAGAKFSLHECGYIRKLVAEAQDADLSMITLSDIPEQARATDDGIYRAIDIYLKAHPSLNELERKKVCSVMDCQKLSREACAHAVQNKRLPIQIVVQVLYFEQQRLRNAMSGTFVEREVGRQSQKIKNSSAASTVHSPRDESVVLRLRQENQDLKLEIERLRMRLCDLEKERPSVKPGTGRPPQYKKKFWNSVSRKLGKLNPFMKLPD